MDIEKELINVSHLINVSFKMLKEPKLLLSIVDKLMAISIEIIDIILKKEETLKNVSFVPNSVDAKIALFEEKVVQRYETGRNFLKIVKILRSLNEFCKNGIVVSKGEAIVVYSDENFSSKIISLNQVKEYFLFLKEFYEKYAK
ncbi:MAG: hypothetical protein QXD62_02965 [Candidatus Woesearchaeota archaeon]